MKGIDLFVKILVFVKILSKSKEGGRIQILRSAIASTSHLKNAYIEEEGVKKAPNCAYVIYEWYLSQLHEDGLSYPASDSVRSTFLSHKLDLNPETKLFDSPVSKSKESFNKHFYRLVWIVEPLIKKLHQGLKQHSKLENLKYGPPYGK